jgi:hypothetical protein
MEKNSFVLVGSSLVKFLSSACAPQSRAGQSFAIPMTRTTTEPIGAPTKEVNQSGSNAERINFEIGASSAIVTGNLLPHKLPHGNKHPAAPIELIRYLDPDLVILRQYTLPTIRKELQDENTYLLFRTDTIA